MLHPINLPDCIHELWIIIEIQAQLLDLACQYDPTDATVLRGCFGPEILNWLIAKHKQKLLDSLEEFYVHTNQAEKQAIVDAFRYDITYHEHLDDPTFVFQLQPKRQLPSPLAESVGKWLKNFYDVVTKKGVPAAVTGYKTNINGQLILEEFKAINTEMYVCPACDGTWIKRTSTGFTGATIDHFLPCSKYPALSVHPFNLIPICATCNRIIKDDKDPLFDNQTRTIVDAFSFYPACQPPRPGRDRLSLRTNSNTPHPWLLQCPGATQAQLSFFQDIFDIPNQWQANVDEVDRLVRRRLKAKMQNVSAALGTISREHFSTILYDLEQRLQREWGEANQVYPATWWLRWLHQNRFDDLATDFL